MTNLDPIPKKRGHVAVRIDDETLSRVDALLPELSSPWHQAKRSDALRALILEALDARDRNAKTVKKSSTKKGGSR